MTGMVEGYFGFEIFDFGIVLGRKIFNLVPRAFPLKNGRCHSVLGIPIPISLAFWVSPSHITAAFWASPGTLPGCPNP